MMRWLVAVGIMILGPALVLGQCTDLTVTNTADETEDNGLLSLRETILTANDDPDTCYRIVLGSHTYELTIEGSGEDLCLTGDLDVHGDVILDGQGRSHTFIDGSEIDRVLDLRPGSRLTITELTVRGGRTAGYYGGGILVREADLVVGDAQVMDNATGDREEDGESTGGGGGIAVIGGTLTVRDQSSIEGNQTGNAADGDFDGDDDGQAGGDAGCGGGIYAEDAEVTIDGSLVHGNRTGIGGDGDYGRSQGDGGDGGQGGDGGGICLVDDATATITDSEIWDNSCGQGGWGGDGDDGEDQQLTTRGGDGGDGGRAGHGGGLYLGFGTSATIERTEISRNKLEVGGGGGYAGDSGDGARGEYGGDGGQAGYGGGIYSVGPVHLIDSSFWNNDADKAGGNGGLCKSNSQTFQCYDGSDGSDGSGGGIHIHGEAVVERVTVSSNRSRGWGAGIRSQTTVFTMLSSTVSGNESSDGKGGGVYFASRFPVDEQPRIDYSTITDNRAETTHGGVAVAAGINPPLELNNTIVAGNNPDNDFTHTGDHNLLSGDPGLGPLADNGGSTKTHALRPDSPAVDAGDPAIPAADPDPEADQRGRSRVEGGRVDIGAVELDQASRIDSAWTHWTDEGSPGDVFGDLSPSGNLEPLRLQVDWSDGQVTTYDYDPMTMAYDEDGPVKDDDDPSGTPWDEVALSLTLWEEDDPVDEPSDAAAVDMTVGNLAPEIVSLDVQTVVEGDTATLEGSFTDASQADTFTLGVDWGDGQSDVYSLGAGVRSFSPGHRYSEDSGGGAYTIDVALTDDDGGEDTGSFAATVNNGAPGLVNPRFSPAAVDEGGSATLKASIDEPGIEDPLTLEIDWDGDGSTDETIAYPAGATSISVPHRFADDDPVGTATDDVPVGVTLSDDDGGATTEPVVLTVRNTSPTLTDLTGTTCDEGGTCSVSGTITDDGPDAFDLEIDWGDENLETYSYPAGTTSFTESHTYFDDPPSGSSPDDIVVTLTLTDDDTGSTTSTTTVTVGNLAPELTGLNLTGGYLPDLIDEGDPGTLHGSFTDPGVEDTFTIEVDWGDGTVETFTYPAGTTSFSEGHTWADDMPTGTTQDPATIAVVLTDDDGAGDSLSLQITIRNTQPSAEIDRDDPEGNPLATDEDTPLTVAAPGVLVNDSDPGDDDLQVTTLSVSSDGGATVTLAADGAFVYDPTPPGCSLQGLEPGESAVDFFEYSISDDDGGTASSYAEVTVTGAAETGAIYVDDSATGADDGSSWIDAFTELQAALAVAWGGNEIHVAAGTYLPDFDPDTGTHTQDPTASFVLKREVSLYGGFPDGGGTWAERNPSVHQSVLSGAVGPVPSEHVVSSADSKVDGATRLDGFVVTGGVAPIDSSGGGLWLRTASPTVARCTFFDNSGERGGGLSAIWGADPWVVNCFFIGNQAAVSHGGGAFSSGGNVRFVNCVFRGNSAAVAGGGIAVDSGTALVAGCSLTNNSAGTVGGGAVAALETGGVTVSNSALWGNIGGAGEPELHNGSSQSPQVAHSDVDGSGGSGSGWWAAQTITDLGGNIDADPQWVAPPADLHLGTLSPLVGVGDDGYVPVDGGDVDLDGDAFETTDVDLDMQPRFSGMVDVGAYEHQTFPVATILPIGTGSGRVTSAPAGIDCGSSCVATFTSGSTVTFTAVADSGSTFLGWLPPCPTTATPCTVVMTASTTIAPVFTGDPSADLEITKTDFQTVVPDGGEVAYTITVRNRGPEDVSGATVTDVVPAELSGASWTCSASTGSSCGDGGAGDINEVVDILSGGVLTYTLTGTAVDVVGSDVLVNTATVTAPGLVPDPDPSNNIATDTDAFGLVADLAVTKDDGRTTAAPGEQLVYTITVANDGPSDALATSVTDVVPAGLEAATWTCSASPGSSCTPSGSHDIADTVDIAPGGELVYTFTATVVQGAVGAVSNTVEIAPGPGVVDPNTDDNIASDTDSLGPAADLEITVDDGVVEAVPATDVVYTITAANPSGPSAVVGARVADVFPAELDCSWSCAGSGGAVCSAGPVHGDLQDDIDLPVASSVTYMVTCTVAGTTSGSLVNTATVVMPPGSVEIDNGDNSATDTDAVLEVDLGDAPAPLPTLFADHGASHGIVAGFHLGTGIDAEADGQPDATATGDDDDGSDDEDGVSFAAPLVTCELAELTVSASADGLLDAWVDFDRNGSWADPDERIFVGEPLVTGDNPLAFAVPCEADTSGAAVARFRFSSTGGLGPHGGASDGEVEDHEITILGLDLGDAPDPVYPTLLASDGARHAVVSGGPVLGASVDAETEAYPSAAADGDDIHSDDDEDGVVFDSPIVAGSAASLSVTASAPALLSAWVDWAGDGSWSEPGDQVVIDLALAPGVNPVSIAVPSWAVPGTETFARFRLDSAGGLGPVGFAPDGEVEDYPLVVSGSADIAVTIGDGVAEAVPGESVAYMIEVANNGPTPAQGVAVSSVFATPLTCTWSCVPTAGATCTPSGAGSVDDTISLEPGSIANYTADCSVDPAASGTLLSSVTAQGPWTDPDTGNNHAEDADGLMPQGDLSITVDDGAATATPGLETSWAIVVQNTGPSVATGAKVTAGLPPELESATWVCSAGAGSSCRASGIGAIGEQVTVAPAVSVVFSFDGVVSPAATGEVMVGASVISPAGFDDPDGANNSVADTDILEPMADLEVDKNSLELEYVDPGGSARYVVLIENRGPSDTAGATVSDTFPAECDSVTWTCTATDGASCSAGPIVGDILDVVDMPAGSSLRYETLCTVATDAAGALSNTAGASTGPGATDPNPANDSSTHELQIAEIVDLSIEIDDGQSWAVPTQEITYSVTVVNQGSADAVEAWITADTPIELEDVSWVCSATGGASCTAGPVSGAPADAAVVPVGGELHYELSGVVSSTAAGNLTVSASVRETDPSTAETALADNDDTDDESLVEVDWGDAPDQSVGSATFPTMLVDGGARHGIVTDVWLGTLADAELDGQPSADADGDDTDGAPSLLSDEDGVRFSSGLEPGAQASVEVTAASAGLVLDAWVDFGADGSWAEPEDRIFRAEPLSGGLDVLPFQVPADASTGIDTFARFRVSSLGVEAPTGAALDGEVEDHLIGIGQAADLALSMGIDDSHFQPGVTVRFNFEVANLGPARSSGGVITALLHLSLSFVSSGHACTADAGAVTCTFGPVAVTERRLLSFDVVVDPSTPDGVLTTSATVVANETDPDPTNDDSSSALTVDGTPPTVLSLETGGQPIVECGTLGAPPREIVVLFSEQVADPPGNAGNDDVTNPDNYLLVEPGPDVEFSTSMCGGVLGDDVEVEVDSVTVEQPPGANTASATLSLAHRLSEGLLRLFVCGSTTVYDLAGNPLDGDGNGIGGDDFLRGFRLDFGNLLTNPHFDCGLDGWTTNSATPGEIVHSEVDSDDSPHSGSVEMHQLAADRLFLISQCVPLAGSTTFDIRGLARVEIANGASLTVSAGINAYSSADCTGDGIDVDTIKVVTGDTGGSWRRLSGRREIDSSYHSARFSYGVVTFSGDDFTAWLDQLSVTSSLFADGFESGDTSAWTATIR